MKYFVIPLGAFVLAAAAITAFWFWQGRPVDIVAVPDGRFNCLSYVPTTPDNHPLVGPDYKVPDGLIENDLKALTTLTKCIRTYSSYGVQGEVLPVAAKLGIKVLLGVWIGENEKRNQIEIDAALKVANQYPDAVRAIVVGNEVMLRREMSGERLAGIIRSVKARTSLPVAYADIYEFWRRNPVIAEAADRLLVHVLPYWDDPTPVSIDDVQGLVRKVIDMMRATFPDKVVEIGEIGWPSAGRTRGYAVPGRVNQARFMREFTAQAGALGIHYNLIEAIDQPWKRAPEGTAGGYWGVLDANRLPKFSLTGPVREWPAWQAGAIFSVCLAGVFIGFVLARRKRPGALASLGIAGTGALSGTCLWMLYPQTQTMAVGVLGQIWAACLLTLAATGGIMLALQIAGLSDQRRSSTAPLSQVITGLRQGSLSTEQKLGLCRWLVLLPAVIMAVMMAVDGRHRDFLTLAFILPALAIFFQARSIAGADQSRPPEEAWGTLILLIAGPMAVDHFGNWEALGWAATCLVFAVPGLPALRAEISRLFRLFAA